MYMTWAELITMKLVIAMAIGFMMAQVKPKKKEWKVKKNGR